MPHKATAPPERSGKSDHLNTLSKRFICPIALLADVVVVYFGGYEALSKELKAASSDLDRAYIDVLGEYRAAQIARSALDLLVPQSFFGDVGALTEATFQDFPENMPNKLVIHSGFFNSKLDPYAALIQPQTIPTAPLVYASHQGFMHSAYANESPLASYLGDVFNRFVFYALQPVPMQFVDMSMVVVGFAPSSFGDLVKKMREVGEKKGVTLKEKIRACETLIFCYTTRDMMGHANDLLTSRVLEYIGIEHPVQWRGEPKQYDTIDVLATFTEPAQGEKRVILTFNAIKEGDPFLGISDKHVFDRMIKWLEFLRHRGATAYPNRLIGSFAELTINKRPITEFENSAEKSG